MQAVTETEIFIVAIIKSRVIETKIPIRDIRRLHGTFYKICEIEHGKIIRFQRIDPNAEYGILNLMTLIEYYINVV